MKLLNKRAMGDLLQGEVIQSEGGEVIQQLCVCVYIYSIYMPYYNYICIKSLYIFFFLNLRHAGVTAGLNFQMTLRLQLLMSHPPKIKPTFLSKPDASGTLTLSSSTRPNSCPLSGTHLGKLSFLSWIQIPSGGPNLLQRMDASGSTYTRSVPLPQTGKSVKLWMTTANCRTPLPLQLPDMILKLSKSL